MLSLTLTFSLTLLMMVAFFSTKKHLHIFELLFVFSLLVFVYTSFVSIISVNLKLWEISTEIQDLFALRLNGVIFVPLTILWLIDLWHGLRSNLYRYALLFLCFFIFLWIGDYILRFYDVYQSHDGNYAILGIVWGLIFFIMLLAQQWFRSLLIKEGNIS